jgi:hypothetical protein
VIFIIGIVIVGLGAAGIAHFCVHAAVAGFPKSVLGAAHNWIFIGLHTALGMGGLILTGFARKRMR